MKSKRIVLLIMTVLLSFVLCIIASASDLDDVEPNTTTSGWAYSSLPGHRGTKDLVYSFAAPVLYSMYNTNVTDGISLWGTNINMTYIGDVNSAGLIFDVDELPDDTIAATFVDSYYSTTEHRILCHIYIDVDMFATYSDFEKCKIIAHELGHVYGLGHVNNSYSIMYPYANPNWSILSSDIWGMKVVTHVHTHGPVVMGTTYDFIDASYHYVTCNSCKGKVKRVHAPNAYGVCACGYTGPFLYP